MISEEVAVGSCVYVYVCACALIEVLDRDALTAFPQPSLNLVTSVALL